jgi:hypothetical protein
MEVKSEKCLKISISSCDEIGRRGTTNEANSDMHRQIVELDELLRLIETRIKKYKARANDLKRLVSDAQGLYMQDKNILRQWFMSVVDLGWYYRQWLGPGHPYPIKASQTRGTDGNPAKYHTVAGKRVLDTLTTMSKIAGAMSPQLREFITTIPELEYSNETFTRREKTFYETLNEATNGIACIRVSSRPIITTATGYLKMIFEHEANFNLARLIAIR